jgi:hypothetical protein
MGFVVSAGGGGRSVAAGAGGGGSCESRASGGGGGGGVVHLTGIKHLGGLGALQWSDEEDAALRDAIQRVRCGLHRRLLRRGSCSSGRRVLRVLLLQLSRSRPS